MTLSSRLWPCHFPRASLPEAKGKTREALREDSCPDARCAQIVGTRGARTESFPLPAIAVALLSCSERVILELLDVWTSDVANALAHMYPSAAGEGHTAPAAAARDMLDWKWQVCPSPAFCMRGGGRCLCKSVCVLVCRDDLEVKERCKMAGDGCTTHRVRARTRASDREVHLPSDSVQCRFLQPVCAFSYLTFRSTCARLAALHVGDCGQAGKQGVGPVGGR